MRAFARKFYLDNYTVNVINDNSIEEGVLHFSRELEADMIAMETHGRTGLAHLINGSITEHVVNHINRPILSVKIKDPTQYGSVYSASDRFTHSDWAAKNTEHTPFI